MKDANNFNKHQIIDRDDKVVWVSNDGEAKKFKISTVWKDIREKHEQVQWGNNIWFSQCNVKHTFILWMDIQRRLQTQDRIMVWKKTVDLKCHFC